MEQKRNRLVELLSTMKIPEGRRTDAALQDPHHLRWLERNMFIYNSEHQHFAEASRLLSDLLRAAGKEHRALNSSC